MTSTKESNLKGARPKTSSKPEKSKIETEAEKQLPVLIMNVSGDSEGEGTARRRKQAIQNVINRHNPDLVLLQEFEWKKIHGTKWSADPVPSYYQLIQNDHASILYNTNELIVETETEQFETILEELQRPKSKHPTPIPRDFEPIPRMSSRVLKTKGVPVMEFICISWHGKHRRRRKDKKVTEFTYLMSFLNEIYVRYHLPILIGGDFNVEVKLICHKVQDPFKLYEYKASERRKKNMIDYFIATTELHLSDMKPVDLKKDSKADKPEDVLDHDPIIAMLGPAPLSDTVPAQNKAASRKPQKTK